MAHADSVAGKDRKVPWQQVATHFIPRWGLATPWMDLTSTEGKAVALACTVRSDTRILKECGPKIRQYKKGEAVLLDGGFQDVPMA